MAIQTEPLGAVSMGQSGQSQMADFLGLAGVDLKEGKYAADFKTVLWWQEGPLEQWIEVVYPSFPLPPVQYFLSTWCRFPLGLPHSRIFQHLLLRTHPKLSGFELLRPLWGRGRFGLRWEARGEISHWLSVAQLQRSHCHQILERCLEGG